MLEGGGQLLAACCVGQGESSVPLTLPRRGLWATVQCCGKGPFRRCLRLLHEVLVCCCSQLSLLSFYGSWSCSLGFFNLKLHFPDVICVCANIHPPKKISEKLFWQGSTILLSAGSSVLSLALLKESQQYLSLEACESLCDLTKQSTSQF